MKAPNVPKTVRFAGENNVEIFAEEEALSPLWLTPEELVGLRNQAKLDADHLKTKGYGMLLKNGFDANDKTIQSHINAFAKLPGRECPRGTETYLFKQHRDQLDRNHCHVVKGVLNRQRLLREKESPVDEVPDKLCRISRKHSKTSRLFARRLGLADQRAVREGDDLLTAQSLIRELSQGNAKKAMRKVSSPSLLLDEKVGGGVAPMANLKYMASCRSSASSKINHPFRTEVLSPSSLDTKTVPCRTHQGKNTFSDVIQDALDLLDDDLDVGFGSPSLMAKTA